MSERFRPSDDVLARGVPPELVILDAEGGEFHVARGIGPQVWELLAAGHSVDDVVDTVTSRYDRPADEVRSDVEAFVAACREKNLLVEAEAGAS